MEYKTPIETIGVRKTIQLLKIVRIPMSPSLSTFTKKGRAANEMALQSEPVMAYTPTCCNDFFNNMDLIFCNN